MTGTNKHFLKSDSKEKERKKRTRMICMSETKGSIWRGMNNNVFFTVIHS